mgnify:CR=1 FL=1
MKPILVSGAHRTGTTWVGRVLSSSSSVTYISEPLHLHHSLGVLAAPVHHWYTYICEENEGAFLDAYQDTVEFRYRTWAALQELNSWKELLKMGRDQFLFLRAGLLNHLPLLKDPFAVFSAPWFSRKLNSRIVICVRHPLAFVSSLKRLGWSFDFNHLLNQPLLMRDHLDKFRDRMSSMNTREDDIVGQGILLWEIIYSVAAKYKTEVKECFIVRHEDLSLRPQEGFSALFNQLSLDFTDQIRRKIMVTTKRGNPQQLPSGNEHAVQLDSRANLKNWENRLTLPEVDRILAATENHLFGFYEEEEWKTW